MVFHHGDLVANAQFALLQACDLQLVDRSAARARLGQSVDRRVEIAVFAAQPFQPLPQLLLGPRDTPITDPLGSPVKSDSSAIFAICGVTKLRSVCFICMARLAPQGRVDAVTAFRP